MTFFTLSSPKPLTSIDLADDHDEKEEEEAPVRSRRLSKAASSRTSISGRRRSRSRRRRRSSARFLHLGDDDDATKNHQNHHQTENLGEIYQKAIRLNAENRINASNSWNLSLIDHLDSFLTSPQVTTTLEDTVTQGVNFTKASCTLDASVKIYSYRVDDVHLTSYKVLANLNRTETNNLKKQDGAGENSGDACKDRREKRRVAAAETLEQNLANINIHKLDSAFDIDPLFHKMSKTFDEGGAKGLLLANLGVSSNGCNIVFDSTLDEEGLEEPKKDEADNSSGSKRSIDAVDVAALTSKILSTLNGQTVHQLTLVPQLASLRYEFGQLQSDGFVEKFVPSKRYASSREEEAEADKSIHLEAIERSRASQADLGRSAMMSFDEDDDSAAAGGGFSPVDFGGGSDGDDDGYPMESFSMHDGDHRFSSASFQSTFEASQPPSQASVLLDAIAAGDIVGSESTYEYFNNAALDKLRGNMWAGATHWKKTSRRKSKKVTSEETAKTPGKKKRGKGAKSKTSSRTLVDITKPVENLDDLLRQPPKRRGGGDPLRMTKAAQSKHTKNENLLPIDAGISMDTLTSLFLRPKAALIESTRESKSEQQNTKVVGFGGVETWSGDYGAFEGDDDDGGGYCMAGFGDDGSGGGQDNGPGEDFTVPELEGVRKVEKIQVGYATIAKKVDVKRLKRDLWVELERSFERRKQGRPSVSTLTEQVEATDQHIDDDDTPEVAEQLENDDDIGGGDGRPLSFQDAVREMQATQSQTDVTLPFYFICLLHLANERGLALESKGLEDFIIHAQ